MMNQPLKKNRFNRASLRGSGSAHTVLLRMAADEARAERVRQLYADRKAEDPRFTWRKIADHVGVSERAAHAWGKTGGIDPENLKKLAEILNTSEDYIWRGRRVETPDMVAVMNGDSAGRLAAIEQRLDQLEIAVDDQNGLLARQSGILERIEAGQAAIEAAILKVEQLVAGVPTPEELAAEAEAIARGRPAGQSRSAKPKRASGS